MLTYNGTNVESVTYNSANAETVTYNSIEVFTQNRSVVLLERASFKTEYSVAPPPYDSSGYNYGEEAPTKTYVYTVNLGDLEDYNRLEFRWNNDGSLTTYGSVKGTFRIDDGSEQLLYEGLDKQGYRSVDISNLSTKNSKLYFTLTAKSESSYKGYISMAAMTIINVTLFGGTRPSPGPEPEEILILKSVTINSGHSASQGGDDPPVRSAEYTIQLGDISAFSKLIFNWNNRGSLNTFGGNRGYYTLYAKNNITKTLFENTEEYKNGTETIEIGTLSGNAVITFYAYAKSESSDPGWISSAVLNISNVKFIR